MKNWLLFLIFSAHMSNANTCHEFYNVDIKGSFNFLEIIGSVKQKFGDFIRENKVQDFTELCQSGVQSCMSGLSKGAKSSAELAALQAKAIPLAFGKALLNPIDTFTFSIEPGKVNDQVVTPLSKIIKEGKDAAANLERIEKGLLDPQDIYKAQNQQVSLSAVKGWFFKKSNKKIIDELRETVEGLEVEIWSHSYYAFGMIGAIGFPKLPATVSLDMATGLLTQSEGSASKMARDIATKIIIERMKNSFKENKQLPMMDRVRQALQDSISFTNAKADILEARDTVFEQFGFTQLLAQIKRDPFEEVQTELLPKVDFVEQQKPQLPDTKRGFKFW